MSELLPQAEARDVELATTQGRPPRSPVQQALTNVLLQNTPRKRLLSGGILLWFLAPSKSPAAVAAAGLLH